MTITFEDLDLAIFCARYTQQKIISERNSKTMINFAESS